MPLSPESSYAAIVVENHRDSVLDCGSPLPLSIYDWRVRNVVAATRQSAGD
jgi:hypothetical protein